MRETGLLSVETFEMCPNELHRKKSFPYTKVRINAFQILRTHSSRKAEMRFQFSKTIAIVVADGWVLTVEQLIRDFELNVQV